jgi:uncharacterized protein (DUF58 family)
VAAFFTLVAVAGGNSTLFIWAIAVGGMAGAAISWSRAAWRGVEVSARFEPNRVFDGEPVTLTVRMVNAKRLPLPLVRMGVWLPLGMLPADTTGLTSIRGYRRRLALPGRSEITLRFPVLVLGRGEYWLDRVEVELSDPFDLVPMRRELKPEADLMVMPEPRIAIPMDVRRRLPFGAPVRATRMFEERERFAGVRAYEPGDPLNRIHWRLTAHSGEPQTKLFEPTRSAQILLVLDLSVGEPFWDSIYPDIAEDTIGWASFLARQAFGSGWRVGVMANTHFTRGRGPLRIPASSARGHEADLFAALSRMPNEPTSDLAPVLRETARRLERGTTAVVITPRPGPHLRHELAALRRRGTEVVELCTLSPSPAAEGSAG